MEEVCEVCDMPQYSRCETRGIYGRMGPHTLWVVAKILSRSLDDQVIVTHVKNFKCSGQNMSCLNDFHNYEIGLCSIESALPR
jgi:hypothetical protein